MPKITHITRSLGDDFKNNVRFRSGGYILKGKKAVIQVKKCVCFNPNKKGYKMKAKQTSDYIKEVQVIVALEKALKLVGGELVCQK